MGVSFAGVRKREPKGKTDSSGIDRQPPLVFELLGCLSEKLGIAGAMQFDVHPELVTCLVMWLDRHVLDVFSIHPIYVDVHYVDSC